MGTQLVETDLQGPLEPDTVGLLLGHSPSALRGLIVHLGVTDPDYTSIVKIMVSACRGVVSISPSDRIAQLLVLPSLHGRYASKGKTQGEQGFGSSGRDLTFLSLDLDQRPILELVLDGRKILGLLDLGTDMSIVARKGWPSGWPIEASSQTLQGLGYAKIPDMSSRQLNWKDQEGQFGVIQPYVLELPISLWRRKLLKDMGFKLSNEDSLTLQKLMQDMGYHPGFGLGKFRQGCKDPINTQQRKNRQGLGFS